MTEHVHEWEIVMLGSEPVGISCECGQARALDPTPTDSSSAETWNIDISRIVRLRAENGLAMNVSIEHVDVRTAFRERGSVEISLRQI